MTFDYILNEQMKDDEFRKEYEAIKPEMDAVRKIVDSRITQNRNHLGLDDAKDEIIRLQELEDARKEINNIERDTMRSMESQFKYI